MPDAIFSADASVTFKVHLHLTAAVSLGNCEGHQFQDRQRKGTQMQPILVGLLEGGATSSANNTFAEWFRSPGTLPVSGRAGMPAGSLGGAGTKRLNLRCRQAASAKGGREGTELPVLSVFFETHQLVSHPCSWCHVTQDGNGEGLGVCPRVVTGGWLCPLGSLLSLA